MKWKHFSQVLIAVVACMFIAGLFVLILPALKTWIPLIANLAGVVVVVFLLVLIACLIATPIGAVLHLRHKQQIQRLEAGKMAANERGYIGAFIAPDGQLISAHIVAHSPEVPAHVHIQEDHSSKGTSGAADWREELAREKLEWEREKFNLLNAPASQQLLDMPRPKIEEIVDALSEDELEFSTGRSLTSNELIKIPLAGKHIKIIGASQMGKTSLIAAILEQIRQKYDRSMVRLVILDLEDMTGNLFEDDPLILEMHVQDEVRKLHARNPVEVATMLTWLDDVMQYRYGLIQRRGIAYVEKLPRILIYFEEFLDWKKTLAQRVPDEDLRNDAMAAINTLSTRGLKVGMHLLICAQVDYADAELKAAMAQFVGINVAFGVKPKAAEAAGFVDSERLKENYAAKVPGRYVIEMIGGGDTGISPEFNVREKLKALQAARYGDEDDIVDGEIEEMEELQPNVYRTLETPRYSSRGYEKSQRLDAHTGPLFSQKTAIPANVWTFPKMALSSLTEQSDATSSERLKEYRLTEQEITAFIAAYKASGSIDRALNSINRGASYRSHAREIIHANQLRQNERQA